MRNALEIRSLFEYNRWANRRTLGSVTPLSQDELLRDLAGSFPSVRDTLAHILGAEWIWLDRWRGISPKSLPAPEAFADLASLRARWEAVEAEQSGFVASLTDDALEREVSYVNFRGKEWTYRLGAMMQHVVNHSSYHRGQVATMLRQLGHRAAASDLLVYLDEGARR